MDVGIAAYGVVLAQNGQRLITAAHQQAFVFQHAYAVTAEDIAPNRPSRIVFVVARAAHHAIGRTQVRERGHVDAAPIRRTVNEVARDGNQIWFAVVYEAHHADRPVRTSGGADVQIRKVRDAVTVEGGRQIGKLKFHLHHIRQTHAVINALCRHPRRHARQSPGYHAPPREVRPPGGPQIGGANPPGEPHDPPSTRPHRAQRGQHQHEVIRHGQHVDRARRKFRQKDMPAKHAKPRELERTRQKRSAQRDPCGASKAQRTARREKRDSGADRSERQEKYQKEAHVTEQRERCRRRRQP